MGLGIVTIIAVIILALVLFKIINFGLKVIGFLILAIVLGVTIWIYSAPPEMHKPFSLETIEYLLKINKDGSLSTTKQVTKTIYTQEQKEAKLEETPSK